MKERMGENKVETQAYSYVDKILITANSLWSMVFLFDIFCFVSNTIPSKLNFR
jgi:hypothetical protein